jgi:hypothetical protein
VYENGELHVGMHVIFHHNKRNEDLDALILVIFPQNGPHPTLSLITIRPGERGPTVKMMVPHRDEISAPRDVGWWCFPEEMEMDS